MKYQAHRGVSSEYPENTLVAYKAAIAQGYDIIELDPKVTKDGRIVMLHDKTLNRTCRFPDGRTLPETVNIADITYQETQAYDAGLFMGESFQGEKIPLLSEVLAWAAQEKIPLKIDNCLWKFPEEAIAEIFDLIRQSGAIASVTCNTVERVARVVAELPDQPLHYDGEISMENLKKVAAVAGKRFTAWIPLQIEATSWFKGPFANQELCDAIHEFADLGIWVLSTVEEDAEARRLGADIVETNGTLKPQKG